ncbi:DUF4328 domain-containing protein [Nonomuraea sp. SBT364]|uniref:DUF4328 domain-containing protein n=1 Tax=Nonomuraea sp. SBT364 TaxID=1580530 RepID=UPI001E4B7329|nr:DUF4328 domain-containing protein [Nonomuraea sp. SBT364]
MRFAQAPPVKAANAVYLTLAAQVLSLSALVIFEQVRGRSLAAQLAAYGGRPQGADAEAVVGAVTAFAVLMMLASGGAVAAGAAYVTWLVRARQVNDPSAATGPVAVAWLIPGVNLVAPAMLVHEVWQGARPPAGERPRWLALVSGWWLSWLTALVLLTIVLPLDSAEGDLTGIGVAQLACVALAALLCAATVRKITQVQRSACAEREAPEPVAALSPFTPPGLGSAT